MTEYRHKPYDRYTYECATHRSRDYVQDLLERADKYRLDPEKTKRLEDQQCCRCFYTSFVAGAAVSFRPCGLCQKRLSSGSTKVDELCKACAKINGLCTACGADIDLVLRRKKQEFALGLIGPDR